ncbi:DNA polymerase III subunit delta' [Desulfopila aestuarii]|uniref:DNA polymerase III, delta prime subunit n=1 Tax=Desulfopila aestuarii DSM 18488 TaxID=1121416 RepID=A0A1M7Y2T0_9BACT|nr:DNA polymerase III subunit delta' [Desulfopila aestuarii]SHO46248.1 DNA polymerase III, delta prime subunit [Desulfopila aestuarii DSM 18488]
MAKSNQILCYTEVRGQEKAKKLVSRTLGSDRVPHAYIFKGPDGVGKRLFARGVAAALNCRGSERGKACGSCVSCRKFLSGNHPDFQVVSPDKGTIKIDQVRQMCRSLSYPPYESELRVVLMEDVHTMRQEAANSLLKTLEEPPKGNLLILTAEASQELLTTISSRCQVIPFYNLSEAECVEILLAEKPEMAADTARLLSRLAEGSPGRALLLHQEEMTGILQEVVAAACDPAIDGERDVGVLLEVAEKMADVKEHLPSLLGLIRLWLRDTLMVIHEPGSAPELYGFGFAPDSPLKNWSSDALFAKLQAVDQAEKELKRNCNRTLVCEVLMFHLHR